MQTWFVPSDSALHGLSFKRLKLSMESYQFSSKILRKGWTSAQLRPSDLPTAFVLRTSRDSAPSQHHRYSELD